MPQSVKKLPINKLVFFIIFFAAALTSCGKIGDPIPPDLVLATTVTDLTAKVEKRTIILRWSLPDGSGRVKRIKILRNERDTKEECSACPREYTPLVEADGNDVRFRRSDKGAFYYYDGEIKSGFSYSYIIVACDDLNYCSEKSNMAETNFQEKD